MITKIRFLTVGLLLVISSTAWAALPAMVNDQEMPSLAPLVERVFLMILVCLFQIAVVKELAHYLQKIYVRIDVFPMIAVII